MEMRKPTDEDMLRVYHFIRIMNKVADGVHPFAPDDENEPAYEPEHAPAILDGLVEVWKETPVDMAMLALDTLMSPVHKLVDPDSEALRFHPEIRAMKEAQLREKGEEPGWREIPPEMLGD